LSKLTSIAEFFFSFIFSPDFSRIRSSIVPVFS
jgi:hypothetical protein